MKFLIMANGDYGDLGWYQANKDRFDRVISVDGGTAWAQKLDIIPHFVVGDMDSIQEADCEYARQAGAVFHVFPTAKDFTDTQLALKLAVKHGATDISLWGGIGTRLDHTLSNLFSTIMCVECNIKVRFESPELTIYIIQGHLTIPGQPGETVSVMVLGGRATGVVLRGFRYPLQGVVLEGRWQYAISNVIARPNPEVGLTSGTLAVFHYRQLSEDV